LWRAGLAIVFILGLAGFAAGVIPQACRSGAVACDGSAGLAPEPVLATPAAEALTADAADGSSPAPQGEAPPDQVRGGLSPQGGEGTTTAPDVKVAAVTNHEPAALTTTDLIAATFDMLDAAFVATPGELTSRKVKTVSIGADGQPVGEAKTDAAGPAPLTPEGPADVAAAPVPEEEPAPEPPATPEPSSKKPVQVAAAEDDVAPVAYAPVGKGNAVVKGSGVNVRSAPKKGANQVLFTLAGGEEVTIVEMSKGWAKVVDSRGRSGWAYGDFLRR
jgi:hypothetical protein